MQVRACAKINLNLRVLGRNPATGFHDIETWIVPVGLHDDLDVRLEAEPGIRFTCSDSALDPGPGNLAWRAADLFLRETSHPGGATVALVKNIPHGAGLGGGSSDAAAVLCALNRLAGSPLAPQRLEALAAQIGSDVPFFVRGTPAMARGRGEILEPHRLPRPLNLLLLKPPFPVETAWAYGAWSRGARCPEAWAAPQIAGEIEIFNDLERPVFAKFIFLAALKQWLLAHSLVEAAAMTGSGSAMFAVLRDPRGADQVASASRAEFGETLWTSACGTASGTQMFG